MKENSYAVQTGGVWGKVVLSLNAFGGLFINGSDNFSAMICLNFV